MSAVLVKYSSPGWEQKYPTLHDAITALRTHICSDCRNGSPGFLDDVVDVEFDGRIYECRDKDVLLSTPCGCEFGIEEDA